MIALEPVTARCDIEKVTESRVIAGIRMEGANAAYHRRILPPNLEMVLRGNNRCSW